MAPPTILGDIKDFTKDNTYNSLELTFESLEIFVYNSGMPTHLITKQHVKLIIKKVSDHNLLQMEVLDNLVFNFRFAFEPSSSLNRYFFKAIQLPRPLSDGYLKMNEKHP